MLPISGPLTTTFTALGPAHKAGFRPTWVSRTKTSRRQRKPYDLPLPYSLVDSRVTYVNDPAQYAVNYYQAPFDFSTTYSQRLYNKAYAKFVQKMRTSIGESDERSAELGATLGEGRQARQMVDNRGRPLNQLFARDFETRKRAIVKISKLCERLRRGFMAARRGDLNALKREFGKRAGIRENLRRTGGYVLEYSFGWAPLMSDLHNAVKVIADPIPRHRVIAREKYQFRTQYPYADGSSNGYTICDITEMWHLQGYVTAENEAYNLAQSLGLINLGSVLWELTPNSYIIDYFLNVSQVIGSLTDFVGVSLTRSSATSMRLIDCTQVTQWNPNVNPGYPARQMAAKRVDLNRSTGLSGPKLDFHMPWNMSPQRALTSLARLVQYL